MNALARTIEKQAADPNVLALLAALGLGVPAATGAAFGAMGAPSGHRLEGAGRGAAKGLGALGGGLVGGIGGAGLGMFGAGMAGTAADLPPGREVYGPLMAAGGGLGAGLGGLGGAMGGSHLVDAMMGRPSWEHQQPQRPGDHAQLALANKQGADGPLSNPALAQPKPVARPAARPNLGGGILDAVKKNRSLLGGAAVLGGTAAAAGPALSRAVDKIRGVAQPVNNALTGK